MLGDGLPSPPLRSLPFTSKGLSGVGLRWASPPVWSGPSGASHLCLGVWIKSIIAVGNSARLILWVSPVDLATVRAPRVAGLTPLLDSDRAALVALDAPGRTACPFMGCCRKSK